MVNDHRRAHHTIRFVPAWETHFPVIMDLYKSRNNPSRSNPDAVIRLIQVGLNVRQDEFKASIVTLAVPFFRYVLF